MHLTGASVAYGRSLLPEPGQGRRPIALGRETGHTGVLVRDSFRPWSPSPAAEPIPPAASLRERVARRWAGDGDEPMT